MTSYLAAGSGPFRYLPDPTFYMAGPEGLEPDSVFFLEDWTRIRSISNPNPQSYCQG